MYVPEAQGGLPPGPHVQYVLGTRTSLGRWVRTAYCGTPGLVQLSGDVATIKVDWRRERPRLARLEKEEVPLPVDE